MKISFSKSAFPSIGRKRRQRLRDEPLTPGQAERVQSLVSSLTKPQLKSNRSARQTISDVELERQVIEAARLLGVRVSSLSDDQRRLAVSLSKQSLTIDERRQMLLDAGD